MSLDSRENSLEESRILSETLIFVVCEVHGLFLGMKNRDKFKSENWILIPNRV